MLARYQEETMDGSLEQATMRKVAWRLVPFICLLYFIAFIDRVNIGFAALTMNKDLGFTSAVFGFGAGVFFLGYFLFEVPSNIILDKVGARLWIARVMITWGILSFCFAFIKGEHSFYILRFLLGAAEAGFFPGIILYLSYWFPARYRAAVVVAVHGGGADLGAARLAALERASRDGGHPRPPRLAVAVHHRGDPRRAARRRRAVLHDRPAREGEVAGRRPARLARRGDERGARPQADARQAQPHGRDRPICACWRWR